MDSTIVNPPSSRASRRRTREIARSRAQHGSVALHQVILRHESRLSLNGDPPNYRHRARRPYPMASHHPGGGHAQKGGPKAAPRADCLIPAYQAGTPAASRREPRYRCRRHRRPVLRPRGRGLVDPVARAATRQRRAGRTPGSAAVPDQPQSPTDTTWSGRSRSRQPRYVQRRLDAPEASGVGPAKSLVSVYAVFAAASAFRRLDWAARFWARSRAPRNVGSAMAIRMPMIRTTTISSMRVKPCLLICALHEALEHVPSPPFLLQVRTPSVRVP